MVSKLPAPVRRILEREEIALALGVAWTIAPLLGAAAGFLFGTIVDEHVTDLQLHNVRNGFRGAGIGVLAGFAFALIVTIVYPRVAMRERPHHDEPHTDPAGLG